MLIGNAMTVCQQMTTIKSIILLLLHSVIVGGQRNRLQTVYVTETITSTHTIPVGIYFVNTLSAIGLAAWSSKLQAAASPEMQYVTNVQGLHLVQPDASCVALSITTTTTVTNTAALIKDNT